MHSDQTRIVDTARGWLGTRFHHQGRLKKSAAHTGGVDCLGLLIGIADELGLRLPDGRPVAALDRKDYPHTPDTQALKEQLALAMDVIAVDAVRPGDVALFNINQSPQHLGVISDATEGLGIIHAYAPARAVVEHALDDWWSARIEAAFRIRPIT